MMAGTVYVDPKASEFRSQDLTDDEIARLGAAIYARIKERLEPDATGRFVAIAVENGDYRVADTSLQADDALRIAHPDAVFYYVRIGFPYAVSLTSQPSHAVDR